MSLSITRKSLSHRLTIPLLMVLALGVGFIVLNTSSTTANAAVQRRGRNDNYPDLGGSSELRQTALNAGYNEGSREGRGDRDKRTHHNFDEYKTYRDADQDYNSRLGDRNVYQRYYRLAFENGYNTENHSYNNSDSGRYQNNRNEDQDRGEHRGRNWDRYGTYGGSFQLRQTALNAGYNAGIKEGRSDRKRNHHRNYNDFGSYKNATTDYSSKLGDKELYRRYYREGFENGYEDGFRGY